MLTHLAFTKPFKQPYICQDNTQLLLLRLMLKMLQEIAAKEKKVSIS